MTTIKFILRLVTLVLRSIDWVAVGRVCWRTIQLIAFVLVLLSEIAWENRQQIRQAVVAAVAAVILAAQLCYEAGCWTRQAIDKLRRRSAALLSHQPIPALAPITATMAAAREALERLVSRLYPSPVTE